MAKPLRVADMFCGAGGFSEGFHERGFEVTYGMDLWGPAVETHQKNHPETVVLKADILKTDPSDIGEVDVLIGSPPCTQFSYANKGGGGDIALGMQLVLRFLEYVAEIKPKYWVMENVPRMLDTLPSSVPYKDLGLRKRGSLKIPVRKVFNSADYGVPQRRLRAVSGDFPVPSMSHRGPTITLEDFNTASRPRWRTMRDVLAAFPQPWRKPRPRAKMTDPNFSFLKVRERDLEDHFMDTFLTKDEVRLNKKSKTDHSWYGKMQFPDDLDRPARTVMATQLRTARETMVIPEEIQGEVRYRRPTVRECASFQGFPLTYQFWGNSVATKYKLVGNAVPPGMSRTIAQAILKAEGRRGPRQHRVRSSVVERSPEVVDKAMMSSKRQLPLDRKFRDHIPNSRAQGARVDINNLGDRRGPHPLRTIDPDDYAEALHLARWQAVLVTGSGKSVRQEIVGPDAALRLLLSAQWDEGQRTGLAHFVRAAVIQFPTSIPDATTLQAVHANRHSGEGLSPLFVLELLDTFLQENFPVGWEESVRCGPSKEIAVIPPRGIHARTAGYLFLGALMARTSNEDETWYHSNLDRAHLVPEDAIPEEWSDAEPHPGDGTLLAELEEWLLSTTPLTGDGSV